MLFPLQRVWIWLCSSFVLVLPTVAIAQIIPESDPTTTTNTRVELNEAGDQFTIDAGTLSGNGRNLFHHFSQFDLPAEATATFDLGTDEAIANILNRVSGDNPSSIHGMVQVLGGDSPNLFLINPAGIVFGAGATLNIGGDFTATTADNIGFGEFIWSATSLTTDYNNFDGSPTSFSFIDSTSAIINSANLTVRDGHNLNFLANSIINSGKLTATDGTITITAIPEAGTVNLSQAGGLVNYQFSPDNLPSNPVDFARLLTGTTSTVETVTLDSGIVLPQTPGLFFSEEVVNANTVAIAGKDLAIGASIRADQLTINADNSFIALPAGDLSVLDGEIAITASTAGLYTDVSADVLTLQTTTGLEIRNPFTVENWSIITNELDIGEQKNTATINFKEPFTTPIETRFLDKNWLTTSLFNNQGTLITQVGDLTLDADLTTNFASNQSLTLESANNLILNGAIAPSNNRTGNINLTLATANNLIINKKIDLGDGILTTSATGDTFVNEDIEGQAITFSSDINIGNITLGSPTTKSILFNGTVDGESNLNVNGQDIQFANEVGTKTPLKNLTLTGDALDIDADVFGTGELSLSPQTTSLTLSVGGDGKSTGLSLSSTDLDLLNNGFSDLSFTASNISLLDNLTFNNSLTLQTTNSSLTLDNLTLNAPNLRLISANDVTLGQITTTDLNITSASQITDTDALDINGVLTLDSGAAIALDNPANNFNEITLTKATDVLIQDTNNLTFTGENITGDLNISSDNLNINSDLDINGTLFLSGNNQIQTRNVTAGENIQFVSNNGNIQVGNLTSSGGSLTLTANNNIQANKLNTFSSIDLISQTKNINVGNLSSATNNINLQALNDIAAGDISAVDGEVRFLANNNLQANNINAQNLINLESQSGNINVAALNSSANGISLDTTGDITTTDISTAENLTLNSSGGTVVSQNINVGNEVKITAQQDIKTRNLTANKVEIKSELGAIETATVIAKESFLGLTTTDKIATENLTAATNIQIPSDEVKTQNITSNGTVTVTTNGNLTTGNVSAQDIQLTAGKTIQTANLTTNNGNVIVTGTEAIATENITSAGTVTATSNGNLSTGDVTTSGQAIALTSGDVLQAGNLTSKNENNGGDITVIATQAIATGNVDSSSETGQAGDVFFDPLGDIEAGYINAESTSGQAGNVTMEAGQFIRLEETFTAASGDEASISTIGGAGNGEINLSHGGGTSDAFTVGDRTVNGSAGALVQGDITIPEGSSFEAAIDTVNIKEFRADEFPQTSPSRTALEAEGFSVDFFNDVNVENVAISEEELNNVDRRFANDYIEKFNLGGQTKSAAVEDTLATIRAQTQTEPAIIYAFFRPNPGGHLVNDGSDTEWIYQDQPGPSDHDVLELVMVTADGDRTRKRINGATRAEVVFQANRFFSHVTNLRLRNAYLYSSQSLYDVLVEPLEAELTAAGIDNITYILDSGLRVLPLAALYDGEQFLIEKYSVGTMPSFELTDTTYQNLNNSSVLAMGSSQFTNAADLPAVPLELERVRSQVGRGDIFLNEQFTLENLVTARRNQSHNLVHLATHGEFLPGSLDNSYIQFWDEQLTLQDLSKLELGVPIVNLLVLSACRTALGNEEAELGFAGLAIASGAKSVLGSLWYVSDEGTLGLMSEFYRALGTTPTKAEALRQAQIAMLRNEVNFKKSTFQTTRGEQINPQALPHLSPDLGVIQTVDLTHPYYWSAFNLVGNPW